MKASLNRIILFVQDVDKLKRFYLDNLELELVEDNKSEWAVLKAGVGELALHKIGTEYLPVGNTPSETPSNTKIVFEIEEAIFEVHQGLKDKGVELRALRTWDGFDYWICDGVDPEGNVFQLRMKKNLNSALHKTEWSKIKPIG